jgi:mRNA-degrading endonuclease RelE of RelBE toxin-antitoxin system
MQETREMYYITCEKTVMEDLRELAGKKKKTIDKLIDEALEDLLIKHGFYEEKYKMKA